MSDAVTTEAIPVDDSVWSRSDLIARIIERHMVLGAELGGRHPAWTVAPRDGEDIHDAVRAANRHLERLDWVLILTPDEPWAVRCGAGTDPPIPESGGSVAVENSGASLCSRPCSQVRCGFGRLQPEGGWLTGNELLDAPTFWPHCHSLVVWPLPPSFNNRWGDITGFGWAISSQCSQSLFSILAIRAHGASILASNGCSSLAEPTRHGERESGRGRP